MTAIVNTQPSSTTSEYKKKIWAWTMYDWANSAFATTILAAVLPIYFSQVAGASLPSATVATSYWSLGLSISLLIIAILSPILGTISDIMRGKKKFLAVFAGLGILSTALLVLVTTGDWILASILGILGRIGFNGANTFYDALLPHVARPEDRDQVSTRGYAMGYLGGGILLAINVVMLQLIPGTWGARLTFLSVAIWWAVFSIPLFRKIPEPPSAMVKIDSGLRIISTSFRQLASTLRDIRQYRELFKFLLAFLIYNDGIGTIIGVAAIYGAELGFEAVELILALLLVQFVGIPFSLLFGRLPGDGDQRRPIYLAFILFNLVALPLVGIWSSGNLPASFTGARPAPFVSTSADNGEGFYLADYPGIFYSGDWEQITVPGKAHSSKQDVLYAQTSTAASSLEFAYIGQAIEVTYSLGPNHGIWEVWLDNQPYMPKSTATPLTIDGFNSTPRFNVSQVIKAGEPGEHTIKLVNTGQRNPESTGIILALSSIRVLPPTAEVGISGVFRIIGLILAIELVGIVLSIVLGKPLFSRIARQMTTKRAIMLALLVYTVVAVWGFFLDSVLEFWFLAWMIAIVQGGSQALSRSLYSAMSPAVKSGEFFGLFGVMEKFSAIIGPLMFAAAGTAFGSSRPAVLSLIVLFFLGGILLYFVDVEQGKRVAQEEDARLLKAS
jgi:MFS transporter, UMF1 family